MATVPEKLNICITANYFPIIGRASDFGFLWPISKKLVELGHNVTVLTAESPQHITETKKEGVQVYFLREGVRNRDWDFEEAVEKKFVELHKRQPFHVLHSVDSSGIRVATKKKEYGIATIFDVNATQMAQLFAIVGMNKQTTRSILKTGINLLYKYLRTYWGVDRKILKHSDGVFVSSPMERFVLERYYYYPDARIHTVPYGIDIVPREDINLDNIRKRLGLNSYNQCVVTTTDMEELDEMRSILNAFEKVVIKKPDLRLIVLGHGPRRHEIEYMIYNLALGNKVILTGAVNNADVPDYIALSDIFININPNTTGFEASLLEAMLQKKVIIGSVVSAMFSIVDDGADGFLIRPADINHLAQLLFSILNGQIDTLAIGEKAHKKVGDLFDTKKMVMATIDAYRTLVDGQRSWFAEILGSRQTPSI